MDVQTNLELPTLLYTHLARASRQWQQEGYPSQFPLVGELLAWQWEGPPRESQLRYLRQPQFDALEVYWFLRLAKHTPHVLDLYQEFYPKPQDFAAALDIPLSRDAFEWATIPSIVDKVRSDSEFVRSRHLDGLREALTLDYPSYILALAMGAGKTVLIGTIIATEFCMSMRYPHSAPMRFMKNALVFAPGTTIIESLREISEMPYDRVLPPNHCHRFLTNVKVEFPHQKGRDLQLISRSWYNIVVTNTEKIRLTARRRKQQTLLQFRQDQLEANLRLQQISDLADLGIFSDEAHHTYGNPADKIKRVRETVDYIHNNTPLVAVVNTTGTPYYKRKMLNEVVVWYGLKEGINDNILKSLNAGIRQYNIGADEDDTVLSDIITDFFEHYSDVALPNGAPAKIAFYFKSIEHLQTCKATISYTMSQLNLGMEQLLVNTQESTEAEVALFRRLNDPKSNIRVILLVQKGVEGWNCPSLFACALIKEQANNIFVLQAATRCLRQVAGNQHPARLYLDEDNAQILDRVLQDNFRTDLGVLTNHQADQKTLTMRIMKTSLPPLEITRTVKRLVPIEQPTHPVQLQLPDCDSAPVHSSATRQTFSPTFGRGSWSFVPEDDAIELPPDDQYVSCVTAAWRISTTYHLPPMAILSQLRALYPSGTLPTTHFSKLQSQIETQTTNFRVEYDEITEAVALIRLHGSDGRPLFDMDGEHFVHRIRYSRTHFNNLLDDGLFPTSEAIADRHDLSYHYSPYNFDSRPERTFFGEVLRLLDTSPKDVRSFLFMGGLTDPARTDFFFEYRGVDERYHKYFPDFLIVKHSGDFLIVEIKDLRQKGDPTVELKARAVERLQHIDTNRFKYHIIYTQSSQIDASDIGAIKDWIEAGSNYNE